MLSQKKYRNIRIFLNCHIHNYVGVVQSPASIKGEETGEGLTEKLFKYDIYRKMLADYFEKTEEEAASLVEEFETSVKRFTTQIYIPTWSIRRSERPQIRFHIEDKF